MSNKIYDFCYKKHFVLSELEQYANYGLFFNMSATVEEHSN